MPIFPGEKLITDENPSMEEAHDFNSEDESDDLLSCMQTKDN